MKVVVVGAGAFGAFAAYFLRRRGARVVLVDAWGPGNARASSGGETRVIRAVYGKNRVYVEIVQRAFELWEELSLRWHRELLIRTGALWMVREGPLASLVADSIPILAELGFSAEKLTTIEAARRYPQIDFGEVNWALFESNAGYLMARQACEAAVDAFVLEGGEFRLLAAEAPFETDGPLRSLRLSDGAHLEADAFVFACGPWLGKLFPVAVGERITPTRQEVFFFGTPEGDPRFSEDRFPVWVDIGERFLYGIPGNRGRGFKFADDTRGEPFDPTTGTRRVSDRGLARARAFLSERFPALADAPLVDSRVCQYENSPDLDFILDRHPRMPDVWLAGGGSGHGFKHAPAVGERLSDLVLDGRSTDPRFSLSRFTAGS